MTIIVAAVVVIPALVASLIYLAIQVREARAQEARASWTASPWGQVQSLSAQAEDLWKTVFQKTYQQTGGNFGAACRSADAASQPYFKAAHAAEELARKASSSSAVRKDTEGRLKG
ncbi:hypothetical protein EUA60_02585 [TM7 phylum sp. oral taxon 346]|nr:hypothetical protein EUA60_02585 [TM7 phylum sp. oral taxon 346]